MVFSPPEVGVPIYAVLDVLLVLHQTGSVVQLPYLLREHVLLDGEERGGVAVLRRDLHDAPGTAALHSLTLNNFGKLVLPLSGGRCLKRNLISIPEKML